MKVDSGFDSGLGLCSPIIWDLSEIVSYHQFTALQKNAANQIYTEAVLGQTKVPVQNKNTIQWPGQNVQKKII